MRGRLGRGRLGNCRCRGVVIALSSCTYHDLAAVSENSGKTPWSCTSTEEIPVTQGPAVGNVDYYVGTHKAPLSSADCVAMSAQFDLAKAYALQWPTEGAAEADGWREATPYINGMGTHHIRGGITPAMLADPSFNQDDSTCTAESGINVNMLIFYMLHVLILDDMQFQPDVFAGMMPCISNGTAVHDPKNACHTSRA